MKRRARGRATQSRSQSDRACAVPQCLRRAKARIWALTQWLFAIGSAIARYRIRGCVTHASTRKSAPRSHLAALFRQSTDEEQLIRDRAHRPPQGTRSCGRRRRFATHRRPITREKSAARTRQRIERSQASGTGYRRVAVLRFDPRIVSGHCAHAQSAWSDIALRAIRRIGLGRFPVPPASVTMVVLDDVPMSSTHIEVGVLRSTPPVSGGAFSRAAGCGGFNASG